MEDPHKFTPHLKLMNDEKRIFDYACHLWLSAHLGDNEGASLCANGALISYDMLVKTSITEEMNEKMSATEFVASCLDVTAKAGADYVDYYRKALSRSRNSKHYATIFAREMLLSGNFDLADDFASQAGQGQRAQCGGRD